MISTLDKITDHISKKILHVEQQDIADKVCLSVLYDLDQANPFPTTLEGHLAQHFMFACKLGQAEYITSITFMIRIVQAIRRIEIKYKIPKSDSLLAKLEKEPALLRSAYEDTEKLMSNFEDDKGGCISSLKEKNIPFVNYTLEQLNQEQNPIERDTRFILINFFVILNRLEQAIQMEKDFGIERDDT